MVLVRILEHQNLKYIFFEKALCNFIMKNDENYVNFSISTILGAAIGQG